MATAPGSSPDLKRWKQRIEQARAAIDPVFKGTPQFVSEPLGEVLGLKLLAKVECLNPIRSFKGLVAGEYDHLPEQSFYMKGDIDEVVASVEQSK